VLGGGRRGGEGRGGLGLPCFHATGPCVAWGVSGVFVSGGQE